MPVLSQFISFAVEESDLRGEIGDMPSDNEYLF